MAAIPWNDAYSIGIVEIDTQHKKLISILNDLYEAHQTETTQTIIQEIIDKLIDYTKYHFNIEQQMHTEYKYPNGLKHKTEHQIFLDKLDDLNQNRERSNLLLALKTIDFLKDWIITHILGSDKAFGDYLRDIELQ
jgi:hemerythrin